MRSKTPDGYYKATSGLLIPKPIAGQYLDKYVVPKMTNQEQNQPGYPQDFRGREFQREIETDITTIQTTDKGMTKEMTQEAHTIKETEIHLGETQIKTILEIEAAQ